MALCGAVFFAAAVLLTIDVATACTTLYASSSSQSFSFVFYSSNTDVCYVIRGGTGKRVEVSTTTLDTDGCDDYLDVYCGGDDDGKKLGRYCDDDLVSSKVSSDREMYVRFRSDSSVEGLGFILYYKEVSGSKSSDCPISSAALAAGIIAAIVICCIIAAVVVVVVVICVVVAHNKKRARVAGFRGVGGVTTTVVHAPPPAAGPVPPPAYNNQPPPAYGNPPPPAYGGGGGFANAPPPQQYPPPAGGNGPAYPPQGVYPPPPANPY